eukprot:14333586-Alexandrium_andersonii.AAC.1
MSPRKAWGLNPLPRSTQGPRAKGRAPSPSGVRRPTARRVLIEQARPSEGEARAALGHCRTDRRQRRVRSGSHWAGLKPT